MNNGFLLFLFALYVTPHIKDILLTALNSKSKDCNLNIQANNSGFGIGFRTNEKDALSHKAS